jgi:hypothetical protein
VLAVGIGRDSAVLDRIRGWAAANDLKPATLARQAGLAETVTRDMDEAAWSPSSSSIRKLEALIPEGWMPGMAVPAGQASEASVA